MWANLAKHWFLISLAICFSIGFVAADTLRPAAEMSLLRSGIVFAVMWAMSVTLRADTVRDSLAQPIPALLAIGINIVVVPLLCLPTMFILSAPLFGGMFIAALVPCTLASASVWTRKAGGDDSVAIITTVVTNLACLLVVPLGIALVLAQQTQVDVVEQIGTLGCVVVAPFVLAQLMRRWGWSTWADGNKARLSLLGQFGILVMVMFGAVASALRLEQMGGESWQWSSWVALLASAIGIHVSALAVGILAARGLGIRRDRQIAIGISGSQKTLMVGLQIAMDCGVSVIPMLVYHLSQLVIDTLVAAWWSQKVGDSGVP